MKKNFFAVVLCAMMFTIVGCSEIAVDTVAKENTVSDVDFDWIPQSATKKEYLDDIEAVLGLSVYLQETEEDMDSILSVIKNTKVHSREGKRALDTYIRIIELSQKGIDLMERMNENNYEEILKKSYALKAQIEALMGPTIEEQLEDLLIAAKKAGVQAEDLEKRGLH